MDMGCIQTHAGFHSFQVLHTEISLYSKLLAPATSVSPFQYLIPLFILQNISLKNVSKCFNFSDQKADLPDVCEALFINKQTIQLQ